MKNEQSGDPATHTRHMRERFEEMRGHLRKDIERVEEPQLRAMFETAAEVIGGLIRRSPITRRRTRPPGKKAMIEAPIPSCSQLNGSDNNI